VDKFGTYLRDQTTGLDYADQRYFAGTGAGRFLSADPYAASGGTTEPSSWNRYPYVSGDPVNYNDPHGLLKCTLDGMPFACADIPDSWCRIDALLPGTIEGCGSEGGGGGPLPLPAPPDPEPPTIGCSISVVGSGTPRNGQKLVGLTSYSPLQNKLGNYDTLTRPGIADDLKGWFFAVQIQVTLDGDLNSGNWEIAQSTSTSGTATAKGPKGDIVPVDPSVPRHLDTPDPRAVARRAGAIDWLDAPGEGVNFDNGYRLNSANLTMSFTSSVTHIPSGASCSVSWSLTFTLSNGIGTFKLN
jgi:RHS repeat-associated protein